MKPENGSGSSRSLVGKLCSKIFGQKSHSCASANEGDTGETNRSSTCAGQNAHPTRQHIIAVEEITMGKELGKGEFGKVLEARWQDGNKVLQVAVKQIPPDKLVSDPASFLREAVIMTRMSHENVIRLYGVVLDMKTIMLVSELALGSLLENLQRFGPGEPFSIDVLCTYASQIANGMAYLERQRLIHRDLAARNVLISSPTQVKISDFGLSRSLGVGEDYYRTEFTPTMKLPIAWCAPECINYLRFTSASDVWAFGVTLWEMFSYGQMPWSGCSGSQILHAIDIGRRVLDRPESCPAQMYDLMRKCWIFDAERRPSFKELYTELLPNAMPQLLVTLVDNHTKETRGSLCYSKNEVLVLLEKCQPRAENDLWLGAIKQSGITGLFHPTETMAHLGAKKPSSPTSNALKSVANTMQTISSLNTAERTTGTRQEEGEFVRPPRPPNKPKRSGSSKLAIHSVGAEESQFLPNAPRLMTRKSNIQPEFPPKPAAHRATADGDKNLTPTCISHSFPVQPEELRNSLNSSYIYSGSTQNIAVHPTTFRNENHTDFSSGAIMPAESTFNGSISPNKYDEMGQCAGTSSEASYPLLGHNGNGHCAMWNSGCLPHFSTKGDKAQHGRDSFVRSMTEEEHEKWERRVVGAYQIIEHRHAERRLAKEICNSTSYQNGRLEADKTKEEISQKGAGKPWQPERKLLPKSVSLDTSRCPQASSNSSYSKNGQIEWSEDCMRAYKLLVQSGEFLKTTQDQLQPQPPRTTHFDGDQLGRGGERTIELAPLSPGRRTSNLGYINSTLVEATQPDD